MLPPHGIRAVGAVAWLCTAASLIFTILTLFLGGGRSMTSIVNYDGTSIQPALESYARTRWADAAEFSRLNVQVVSPHAVQATLHFISFCKSTSNGTESCNPLPLISSFNPISLLSAPSAEDVSGSLSAGLAIGPRMTITYDVPAGADADELDRVGQKAQEVATGLRVGNEGDGGQIRTERPSIALKVGAGFAVVVLVLLPFSIGQTRRGDWAWLRRAEWVATSAAIVNMASTIGLSVGVVLLSQISRSASIDPYRGAVPGATFEVSPGEGFLAFVCLPMGLSVVTGGLVAWMAWSLKKMRRDAIAAPFKDIEL